MVTCQILDLELEKVSIALAAGCPPTRFDRNNALALAGYL